MLSEYQRRVSDMRLVLRGVSPTAIAALDVAEHDLSTAANRAGAVLAMLPMLLLLLATVVGSVGVASDITAGERERGSLESLLLNPAPRWALVIGKMGRGGPGLPGDGSYHTVEYHVCIYDDAGTTCSSGGGWNRRVPSFQPAQRQGMSYDDRGQDLALPRRCVHDLYGWGLLVAVLRTCFHESVVDGCDGAFQWMDLRRH